MARGRSGWVLGAAMALLAGCVPEVVPDYGGPRDGGTRPDAGAGPATVTAALVGVGRGAVLSSAGPLSCVSGLCSQRVPRGTKVTLTALPAQGSRFSGWEGACTGTDVCELTADFDPRVTARFLLEGYWATTVTAVPRGVGVTADGDVVLFAASFTQVRLGNVDVPGGAFLARFSGASGEVRWISAMPDLVPEPGEGNALTINPDGTLVLTGGFRGTVHLGGDPLHSMGDADIFVAGFAPDGRPLWSRRYGGARRDVGYAIASRGPGAVAVAGQLGGATAFEQLIVSGPVAAEPRTFVLELSTAGAILNAVGVSPLIVRAVAGNARGDVWVAGKTDVTAAMRLLKLSGGSLAWTRDISGPPQSVLHMLNGLAVDDDGTATVAGHFHRFIDFGHGQLPANGNSINPFVARYGDGSSLQWARAWLTSSDAFVSSVSLDGRGEMHFAGWTRQGPIDVGGGELPGASLGEPRAFVARLSPEGEHRYSQAFILESGNSAPSFLTTRWAASNPAGVTVFTGTFYGGTVDFGDTVRPAPEPTLFLLRFPPL